MAMSRSSRSPIVSRRLWIQTKSCALLSIVQNLFSNLSFFLQLVLDAGKLVEFDTPSNLLQKEGGLLKSLVDGSGDRDALYEMAAAAAKRS